MKNVLRITCILLIVVLALPALPVSALNDMEVRPELRGVWVATVVNIDYPLKPSADPEILKNEALKILDNAEALGLNAVFLQVRPTSDAMYKSRIFPWSKYLTGKQGSAPAGGFDPLEFWIEEAHKRNMELHAWINPYRVTKKTVKEPKHDFASLDALNPAKQKPEWVVKYTDGNLYYNPGIPEVRRLVIDGVLEIVDNYDVDGIHFDDYFYPGKDFDDKAAFAKYGSGYSNVHDWRRANINALISDLSKALKENSRKVRFGISPFGIWANKSSNALGSETNGMQSFYDQYADTRKWVKEALIDYIAPQIYWNIGYSAADYSKLLSWWSNTASGTGVDLYVGQAAYRCGSTDSKSPWYGVSELERQLQLNSKTPEVKGSIFFSSKSLTDNPAIGTAIKAVYEKKDESRASIPVSVSRPSGDIRTSFDKFYINGASDPGKLLYLNGRPVDNRSALGYFGVLVPLEKGENVFTLSQEGSAVTRIIYRDIAASVPENMSKAEIPAASVFPQNQEYRSPGEKITFSCKAPAGSKVTVTIDGKNYTMVPSSGKAAPEGLFTDTFTYVYTIPSYTGASRNIDMGEPVYSMNYKGIVNTCKAPAKVGVIMKGSPFYAAVEKEVANTYDSPSSSGGAAYELYKGMVDYVTGMTGSYVRLSLGQWVNKSDVKVYSAETRLDSAVKSAAYTTGDWWDALKLTIPSPTAATAAFDGKTMSLSIAAASSAALPVLPEDSPFASVTALQNEGKVLYTLTLKNNQRIDGYYIEKTAAGITLNIKKPVKANDGDKPLAGITVMLDPGHGGSDTGALGPLGSNYAEKTINLNTALKLQAELDKLGARVIMTRTTDNNVSLEERLSASRNAKPDMFISIHGNSMEDNVDISKVDGLSVFYREKLSQPFAETVFNSTLAELNRGNKGMHNRNLYVVRGTWTPSVLIESGFVPNPFDFEWMTDKNEQARLAESIAKAVVNYFGR